MAINFAHIAGRLLRRTLRLATPFFGTEIPVLTYHSIDHSGSLLSVAPATLRSQLARLRAEKWRSLSIAEYAVQISTTASEPRTLLITFDDGYRNFAEHALPLLTEFGFKATIFVPVDYVGKQPLWLERDRKMTLPLLDEVGMSAEDRRALEVNTIALLRDPLMDWPELRELAGAGFDIQSHSCAHHFLTTLPPAQVTDDLIRSRKTLEDRLGRPVQAIAYPYGASNPEVAAAARDAGFDLGFVSDHGPCDARSMMLWRAGVSGQLNPPELITLLRTWPLYPRLRHLVRRARRSVS
jgi:peptidoglycan/xylan/chitin deacetylase (PgdA/CDA1 family)